MTEGNSEYWRSKYFQLGSILPHFDTYLTSRWLKKIEYERSKSFQIGSLLPHFDIYFTSAWLKKNLNIVVLNVSKSNQFLIALLRHS